MESLTVGEYTAVNSYKLDRAINGTMGSKGALVGGVGSDADPKEILAEYDRLGGLILKGKYKVKTGSFYDFKAKKPFAKPSPVLVFSFGGEFTEVPADEPIPVEVRAQEQAQETKRAKQIAKAKGKGKGKVAEIEDEDEDAELA